MIVSFIVAASENGVIGSNGDMPWKLRSDLQRFKKLTLSHAIIMGSKTYLSIGNILPQRCNIIISRNSELKIAGALVAHSIEEAIEQAKLHSKDTNEIFIIGGGEIFKQSYHLAKRIYLTKVLAQLEGDTYFPNISADEWVLSHEEYVAAGEHDNYETIFQIYDRR